MIGENKGSADQDYYLDAVALNLHGFYSGGEMRGNEMGREQMREAVVLAEQQGLWIEKQLLQRAGLGEHFRIIVEPGQVRVLPAETPAAERLPYHITAGEAKTVLKEARQEALELYGGQPPPADQPYFGGMTWGTYQALTDEQRRALWDKLYAEFDVEIEAVQEHDVRPDAVVAG